MRLTITAVMSQGFVAVTENNEEVVASITGVPGDPSKVRLVALHGGTYGVLSFGHLRSVPGGPLSVGQSFETNVDELGFMGMELDERYRRPDGTYREQYGVIKLFGLGPPTPRYSDGMRLFRQFRWDDQDGSPSPQSGGPASGDRITADNGTFLVVQGDDNIVLYRADGTVLWAKNVEDDLRAQVADLQARVCVLEAR